MKNEIKMCPQNFTKTVDYLLFNKMLQQAAPARAASIFMTAEHHKGALISSA